MSTAFRWGLLLRCALSKRSGHRKLIPNWLKDNLDKEHDKFSEWLVRKDQIDDIKPKDDGLPPNPLPNPFSHNEGGAAAPPSLLFWSLLLKPI